MSKAIKMNVVHTSAVFTLRVLEDFCSTNPRFVKPIWDDDTNFLKAFRYAARRYAAGAPERWNQTIKSGENKIDAEEFKRATYLHNFSLPKPKPKTGGVQKQTTDGVTNNRQSRIGTTAKGSDTL